MSIDQEQNLREQINAKQMLADQREANAQMVHTTLRAQELAERADAARALAEAAIEELRESEERYRILFEVCPVAVYSCDVSGVIQKFNRHAVALWGRAPAVGATAERFCGSHRLYHPDGRPLPHEQCPMAEALRGGVSEVRDAEVVIERADGSRVAVVVNIRPLRNQLGHVTGAINCFYDITERKRAEERRAKSEELRERLLGIVGHDLRTPLSVITTGAVLLQQGELSDSDQRTAARIGRSADRMVNMISHLLDFTHSRLGGGIPVQRSPVQLAEVCADVISEFEVARPDRELRLETEGDTEGMWDGGRLAQVVNNLIGNAIQYGAPARPIDVRVGADEADVCVTVHNDGSPIPVELLPVIFEPFRRGANQRTSQTTGLGLGLFIAREIVQAHGGELEVCSNETAGTTFTARLPRKFPH